VTSIFCWLQSHKQCT